MIEIIILNYLNDTLDVPVYMEDSKENQKRYVLLKKTSSSKQNYINYAMFAIQSYAESLYEAAKLNEAVKKAMDNIVVLDTVSKSELNSDYEYTDMTKKKYRYQAVYSLVYF